MSDSFTSGSFSSSRVVAYNLTERFEKTDRKLVAVIYGMDALWYSEQAKEEKVRSIRFPVILGGISPIRFLVYGATSGKDMPEDTAAKGYRLFVEFVSLNKEAVGFVGELQFNPRDVSSVRLPLALFLELESMARADRLFAEDPRLPAEVMGMILNTGKGAVDEETHRPGAEFSELLSKLCPLSPGSGVLDMSCGTGTLLHKLLTDKTRIRAFGQEMDAELAVISWLRLQLHPSAESAKVYVGDSLRYTYASSYQANPIDVALVHSIDLDADEENKASFEQYLREAAETEQRATRQGFELEKRCEEATRSLHEVSRAFERLKGEAPGLSPSQAAQARKEFEARVMLEEARLRDLQQQHASAQQMASEASRALKAAYERAKKPARDRTYDLIMHGLDCVGGTGMAIAVVSARELFKSPQVDRLRTEALTHDRLDLVVELPRGVDGAEDRVAVLVFRRGRKGEPILFVDATDHETVKKAVRLSASEPVIGYRRSRSTILTSEFFSAIAQVCVDRVEIPGVSALVPRSALGGTSVDGRQVDLRPRQFIVTDRLEESAGDSQTRLAECHQAVVNAEAALLKARAQLGLDPLFTKTQTSKPTRRSGTH
jgi:N-6 DNA Methylase/Methionine biosynthesis protein MetW